MKGNLILIVCDNTILHLEHFKHLHYIMTIILMFHLQITSFISTYFSIHNHNNRNHKSPTDIVIVLSVNLKMWHIGAATGWIKKNDVYIE